MNPIPGYRYSTGPVKATIPGFRYSQGPILADEDDDILLKLSAIQRKPSARLTKNRPEAPKLSSRQKTSFDSTADSAIDVDYAKSYRHTTPTVKSSKSLSRDSCPPETHMLQKTPALTPMSYGSAFGSDYQQMSSTIEERFVFPKAKPSAGGWVGRLKDHLKQKGESGKEKKESKRLGEFHEAQAKSDLLLTKARKNRAMEKRPDKIQMWLTKEEKRVVEDQRRRILEMRLERAQRGRSNRVGYQMDETIGGWEAWEFSQGGGEGMLPAVRTDFNDV